VFVPPENAEEAALIEGVSVFSADSLIDLIAHLDPVSFSKYVSDIKSKKKKSNKPIEWFYKHAASRLPQPKTPFFDAASDARKHGSLADIRGQESAKRALEIAAAGGHNILLFGPPGTGKTLLAKAFSELLPTLSFKDALDVTAIHSATG